MTEQGASSVLEDIRSRGYWHVVVRPVLFHQHRIADPADLQPLLESMQVHMPNWDFPYLDDENGPKIKGDYIEQAAAWEDTLDFFRFSQSGQFAYLSAFVEDWQERLQLASRTPSLKAHEGMGISAVLNHITAAYEFAARFAQKMPGDDDIRVEIAASGIAGRKLVVDRSGRAVLRVVYQAEVPRFSSPEELARAEFISRPRELALGFIMKLFRQFQWKQLDIGVLRGWQSEIFPPR